MAAVWKRLLGHYNVSTTQCCFVAASCDWGEDGHDVQREPCRHDERRSGALSARQLC